MKNSLRISTFIIALVVIIAGVSTSHASGTRMSSLGMGADTFWMIQKDTAYGTVNPGYFVQFPALITFNESTTAGASGQIWLKPMDDLMIVLAAGGQNAVSPDSEFALLPSGMNATNQPATREKINFAASYKMGPMSFGLRYGISDYASSTSIAGTKVEANKSTQTIHAGMFMDLGGGMDFDAAIKYTSFDYSQKGNGVASKYKADPTDLDITARFNMGLSENNRAHVWLRYNPKDRTDKLGTTKNKYTIDKTSIGLSDELKFTQAAFAYVGFLYEMISEEKKATGGTKTTIDTNNLIFVTGAQASLTKALTMTLGASRTWIKDYASKTGTTKTEYSADSSVTGSWGLQWKKGHWTLEGLMTRSLLTSGPWFISGSSAGAWAANINLAYIFGNTADLDEVKK